MNVVALLLVLVGALPASAAGKINPRACRECHEDFHPEAFAASVHGGLDCVDCHTQGPFGEHEEIPPKVDCGTCHEDQSAEWKASIHGQARTRGVSEAPDCVGCHGDPHTILTSGDDTAPHARKNIPLMCAKCHADPGMTKKYNIPLPDPLAAYRKSVHGKAHDAGNMKAAVCSDCHGAHTVQPGREMSSLTARRKTPETCGRCHEKILEEFRVSVHGAAVLQGNPDAPTCSTCHGEHGIVAAGTPDSALSAEGMITRTCGHCHEDLAMAEKYGFQPVRVSTYLSSYHGMAVRRGAVTVANCASCHGIHNILPSGDPKSSIHPSNLAKTCGQCHPQSGDKFSQVPVHILTSPTASPILYYARLIYLNLIVGTIGLMLLHNLFLFVAAIIVKLRRQRAEKRYVRFTGFQILMHAMLFSSFFTLVITGFALHFHDMGWTHVLNWIHLTEEARRIVHRVAACVMLASGFLHIGYILWSKHGRYDFIEFIPRFSDLRDFRAYLAHHWAIYRNRTSPPPKLGRYTYIHKAEYWALVWGTMVMSATGFALWFPTLFSRYLPVWGIPLAELIHYYEAWLATLSILVWHFFFVIFHPDEYPMSTLWMTGKATHEEMERDHPRELEELEKRK